MLNTSKLTVGALLFAAGGLLLLLAIVQLRQARRALREARRSLTERNKFAGMMAHEMLTPLQTIVSSVELLELGGHIPVGDQNFRRLRRSAQQLEAQMNDTVEFARLTGGRLQVSSTIFQPDLMMQLVVAEFDEVARERGVHLKVRVEPQPCPRVATDPARMRQIVVNLVSNAAKYASPGEVLCSVQVSDNPGSITVAVVDHGPGFDPALDLWEPFTRGKAQGQAGSGLGLPVVKMMVELLGGCARVARQPDGGSAFTAQVPVEVQRVAAMAPEPAGRGPLRVLVVEDHPDVAAGLRATLAMFGARVEQAGTVREANERLRAVRYDGVLLDLRLPDGSGYDVARAARAAGALNQATPLVALSAYHEVNAAEDALFAAKFDKPISAQRLRAALALFG